MRQMKQRMPIYTGDVSGVASALYELGGMVIMHDASGCNSTYNTHDELRWYDKESLIYISAMTEIDAVMGNDKRLIAEITEAAAELRPGFIAIAGTPIPYLNGMDFKSVAKIIEKQTGIPTFFVPTNGTHTYIEGVSGAFTEYLKHCMLQKISENTKGKKEDKKHKVNIIGVTPLDFALSGIEASISRLLTEHGYEKQCCLSMESTVDEIAEMCDADVSLVVSSVGLDAAKLLERTYDIPYVVGMPVGCFAEDVFDALENTIRTGISQMAYITRKCDKNASVKIVGETVVSESVAAAIGKLYEIPVQVLCPVETRKELLLPEDRLTMEEEELEQALEGAKIVIADPLLAFMCPTDAGFYPLPHVACSGRIYAKNMPDLTKILMHKNCTE